jgi:hypothetical protein
LFVMKKNIESTDENSDTVSKELKGATKKVVENEEYLVEKAGELDKKIEVDCLDGGGLSITEFFTLPVPTSLSRKMKRCDLAKIMVDIWSVLQFAASDGLIWPDKRTPLINFIKIMEKAEEKAREEMKSDGENNNVVWWRLRMGLSLNLNKNLRRVVSWWLMRYSMRTIHRSWTVCNLTWGKRKLFFEVCLTSATRWLVTTEEELFDYQTLPVHDGAGKKVGEIWKPSQVPKRTLAL